MRNLRIGCINAQYMCKICARFSPNVQYMRKIWAGLYFFLQCAIYAQDLRKIVLLSPMRNICARFAQDCTSFSNAQYMRKIVLLSPMRSICARFAQDCSYFFNAQYMRKICARLLISSMCKICARFPPNAQDLRKILSQCAIYAQDLHKIVLLSPMCNICARFAQDCTSFPNAQYMRKICARLYFFLQYARFAQDCSYFSNVQYMRKIVVISPMRNICARLRKIVVISSMCIYAQDLRNIVLLSPMRNICALRNKVQSCAHLVLPWVKAFE